MPPVFEFTDTYDTTVTILGRVVPIIVKRYSRDESDALWLRSQQMDPKGSPEMTDTDKEERSTASLRFFEEVISSSVTLAEGVILDRGQSVTTGAGLLHLFGHRLDALAALAAAVIVENRMMPSLAKNSNSLRGSGTGSERSIPARSGDEQGPTVTSAEPLSTAPVAPATEAPEPEALRDASSGTNAEVMAPA